MSRMKKYVFGPESESVGALILDSWLKYTTYDERQTVKILVSGAFFIFYLPNAAIQKSIPCCDSFKISPLSW